MYELCIMNYMLRNIVTLNSLNINITGMSTTMEENIYWSRWICLVDGPRNQPLQKTITKTLELEFFSRFG